MERLDALNESVSKLEKTLHLSRYALAMPYLQDKRVLDVGCGFGYGTFLLKQWGARTVTGIDVSSDAADFARSKYEIVDVNFECVDALDSSWFSSKNYDVIICVEVLEHVENPVLLMKNLKSVSGQEGLIIFSCPNDYWYYPEKTVSENPYHLQKWSLEEFQEIISSTFVQSHFMNGYLSLGFIGMPYKGSQEYKNLELQESQITAVGQASFGEPSYFASISSNSEISLGEFSKVIPTGSIAALGMDEYFGSTFSNYGSPFSYPRILLEEIERMTKRIKAQDALIWELTKKPQ